MGLPQARVGDKTSGHGPYLPTPLDVGSSDVYINGKAQIYEGATQATPHTNVPPAPPEPPRVMGQGSSTVFINGQQQNRLTDQTECGGFIIEGSSDVFIG